jgi:hypothetical protein
VVGWMADGVGMERRMGWDGRRMIWNGMGRGFGDEGG